MAVGKRICRLGISAAGKEIHSSQPGRKLSILCRRYYLLYVLRTAISLSNWVDEDQLDENRKAHIKAFNELLNYPDCALLSRYIEKEAYNADPDMGDRYSQSLSNLMEVLKESEETRENVIKGMISIQSIEVKPEF